MNADTSRASSSVVDNARQIVRRTLAGKVPVYYYLELTEDEQTNHRGKPRPYLVAGAEILRSIGGGTVVEIGGMRSPLRHDVSEFNPVCCNDGHSTAIWSYFGFQVHSVDINPACREAAATLLDSHPNLRCHTEDGIAFLRRFGEQIDLLYLDAWDVIPGEPYAERHLEAYLASCDKLAGRCIVQIDDTDIYFGGKGELVVPRLIRDGFELLVTGRQTILIRGA